MKNKRIMFAKDTQTEPENYADEMNAFDLPYGTYNVWCNQISYGTTRNGKNLYQLHLMAYPEGAESVMQGKPIFFNVAVFENERPEKFLKAICRSFGLRLPEDENVETIVSHFVERRGKISVEPSQREEGRTFVRWAW